MATTEPKRLRDVDAAERAFRIKTLAYAAFGGFMGAVAGPFWLSRAWPEAPGLALLGAAVAGYIGATGVFFIAGTMISGGTTFALSAFFFPRGSPPLVKEFSYAESLVIRGDLERAALAYEAACLEDPADPEPRVRLARLLRDQLGRPEEAVAWFRAAREAAGEQGRREEGITRELVELLTRRLDAPARALPELARAAARWQGSPGGEWAAAELARWKAVVHGGEGSA